MGSTVAVTRTASMCATRADVVSTGVAVLGLAWLPKFLTIMGYDSAVPSVVSPGAGAIGVLVPLVLPI